VVIRNGTVALRATEAKRAIMRGAESGADLDFGPERYAFETLWTRENYDALTDILAGLPVHWRFFVKTKLFEKLPDLVDRANENPVRVAFAALVESYPQITVSGVGPGTAKASEARTANERLANQSQISARRKS